MNQKYNLNGSEKIKWLLDEFPASLEVLESLGISEIESNDSLVGLARAYKMPLPILLNNLAKKLGVEVDWPKINGGKEKDAFSSSTALREGKPQQIKSILAVHSGKGGVGKTFVSIALAKFFEQKGLKTALLDLDIDCPNIPRILNLNDKLKTNQHKKIAPLNWENIEVVSMGNIQEEEKAIMWRGPILSKAIEQLLHDTEWGNLDLLIIDLPPGTGDVPLTVFNLVKPDQVVIVTTPQSSAMMDAMKAFDLAKRLNLKVAGIVENMTGEIFGNEHDDKFFAQKGVNFLGSIPLKAEFNQEGFWTKENQYFEQQIKKIGDKILF